MRQQDIGRFATWFINKKAKQLIGKAGFTRGNLNDLRQDLKLDLLQRRDQFDPQRTKWNTFVAMVVVRHIATILEHCAAARRDCRREQCSLNASMFDHEGKVVERHETLDADGRGHSEPPPHDLVADVHAVMAGLPPRLHTLCVFLQTKTMAQAARDLGVPRNTLYRDLKRLRAAFEQAGLGDYLPEE